MDAESREIHRRGAGRTTDDRTCPRHNWSAAAHPTAQCITKRDGRHARLWARDGRRARDGDRRDDRRDDKGVSAKGMSDADRRAMFAKWNEDKGGGNGDAGGEKKPDPEDDDRYRR